MSAFSDPLLSSESGIVSEYISLLERQQPIEVLNFIVYSIYLLIFTLFSYVYLLEYG